MRKHTEKRVPELRFKGFTDDWEQYMIEDCATIITGGTPKTSVERYWFPKEIPWMASGEINKKRIYKTEDMISKEGYSNSSAKMVNEKSVLIALAGQGKTRGTVAVTEIALTTNQSIAAIEPHKDISYEFLFQNLESRYEELRTYSSGDGSRGGLNKKLVSEFPIISPVYNEQYQIGLFFLTLDKLITLYQRKTALLEQVKKSNMRDLLPEKNNLIPSVRFEGFNDIWIENNLGNISDIRTGTSDLQDSVKDGKYPFFVRSENIETSNRYLFNGEAILIPGEGRLGDIYHYINGKFDYHQRVYKISNFNDFNNLGLFILYYMQKNFKRHALKFTVKATVESLRLPSLLGFKIKLPTTEEQLKISNYFRTLDNSIMLYESKLENLIHLKKFFLKKLFI